MKKSLLIIVGIIMMSCTNDDTISTNRVSEQCDCIETAIHYDNALNGHVVIDSSTTTIIADCGVDHEPRQVLLEDDSYIEYTIQCN